MSPRFLSKSLFAVAALAASAAVVSPALAGVTGHVRTAIVSYADLDLTTEAGVDTLNGRIRRAAADVCGAPMPMSLLDFADMKACRAEAVASARRAAVTVIAAANSDDRLAANDDGFIAVGGR